jgi:3-methyl-2-oxobutanoate hydroxymethyltransferase
MSFTIHDLARFKRERKRFIMLTAYDYPTAQILDEIGVPIILVGDSLAQVILGYDTTLPVTMEEMLHHTKAVVRGAPNALIIGDMPFGTYLTVEQGIENAARFLKEGGAHAIKVEGPQFELTEALADRGIPVMAHLGLTPQSVHAMGGYKVQAKTDEAAARLLANAQNLQKSGAFSLVLEGIPSNVARHVTELLDIATIGIGAGPQCDAQVLVITDLLGLGAGKYPKFVKPFANLREEIAKAVGAFRSEVEAGTFPDETHSYS